MCSKSTSVSIAGQTLHQKKLFADHGDLMSSVPSMSLKFGSPRTTCVQTIFYTIHDLIYLRSHIDKLTNLKYRLLVRTSTGENRPGVRTFKVYLQQRSSKVTWNYTWDLTFSRWNIYWPGLDLEENTHIFLVLFFCLLLHGLAVRISLPYHVFSTRLLMLFLLCGSFLSHCTFILAYFYCACCYYGLFWYWNLHVEDIKVKKVSKVSANSKVPRRD